QTCHKLGTLVRAEEPARVRSFWRCCGHATAGGVCLKVQHGRVWHLSDEVSRAEHVRSALPKSFESNPTLAIHSDTSRAYCRVVMHRPSPRLPMNRKSPDLLPAVFR